MYETITVTRTARLRGGRVEVLNAQGQPVWMFDPVELAIKYLTLGADEFYVRYMFLWVPPEPYYTIARGRLRGYI